MARLKVQQTCTGDKSLFTINPSNPGDSREITGLNNIFGSFSEKCLVVVNYFDCWLEYRDMVSQWVLQGHLLLVTTYKQLSILDHAIILLTNNIAVPPTIISRWTSTILEASISFIQSIISLVSLVGHPTWAPNLKAWALGWWFITLSVVKEYALNCHQELEDFKSRTYQKCIPVPLWDIALWNSPVD